jgi:hypothetical protein
MEVIIIIKWVGFFKIIKGGTGNPTTKPVLLKQKIEFNINVFVN